MSNQWQKDKEELNSRRDAIQTYITNTLPTDIIALKASLTKYIKKGGVSKNPANDPDYNEMMRLYAQINTKKSEYRALNKSLTTKIKKISTDGDIGRILQENGTLQTQVSNLEGKVKESEDDVKSAELRDELLRSQNSNITKHQVFMIGRPLRPSSIPYLWALSILFIGAALLVFQTQGPPLLVPLMEWYSMSGQNMFFTGSRMWMILAGALSIVILFLSLRVANVI